MKNNLIYLTAGLILGFLLSMKMCRTKYETTEIISEPKVITKTDTFYKTTPVYVKIPVPVEVIKTNKDTIIKTEYKDKYVTIKDYYPKLDSNCLKQLDSIQREILYNKDTTFITKNDSVFVTKTITKTEIPYKRIYFGGGLLYDNYAKEWNYSYNAQFQFRNRLTIGAAAFIPLTRNNAFQTERYNVHLLIPVFKFK